MSPHARTSAEPKTSRLTILVTLIVPLLLAAGSRSAAEEQKIPALLDVPRQLAADRPDLARKRTDILSEHGTICSKALLQKQHCFRVVAGSAQDTACLAERGALKAAISLHVSISNALNAAVRSAVRYKLAVLCSSLDDELREMHAVDLEIVELELDALGEVLEVPLG